MSHFHNRAQRACCRGKRKNFCQFMEIKDPESRQAGLAGTAWLGGAGSFLSPGKHLESVLWKEPGHSQWGAVRDVLGVTAFPTCMCNQHKTELCFGVTAECFAAGTGISLGFHFKQVLYLTHCFLQICFVNVHRTVRFALC